MINDHYCNLILEEEKQSLIVPYISCSIACSNKLNKKILSSKWTCSKQTRTLYMICKFQSKCDKACETAWH
jgi:hypothetical protein